LEKCRMVTRWPPTLRQDGPPTPRLTHAKMEEDSKHAKGTY
jgi:hypothetical protein